jgi:tetratricopeptide (TPR) repeat protein
VLGQAALADGAYAEAQASLQACIGLFREVGRRAELGWALATAAIAACRSGRLSDAQRLLSEALQSSAFLPLLYGLPAAALFLAGQGDAKRAVEVYALASRYPHVANSRWFEDVVGRHVAAAAHTQGVPPDVVAAAEERGRSSEMWDTAAQLTTELAPLAAAS